MKSKLILLVVVLVAFGGGAAFAAAAASWPASCSGYACVNNHLNDLNRRVKQAPTTFQLVEEQIAVEKTGGGAVAQTIVSCPAGTTVVGGGVVINGEDEWYLQNSAPTFMNGWDVKAVGPATTTLTSIVGRAVCAK